MIPFLESSNEELVEKAISATLRLKLPPTIPQKISDTILKCKQFQKKNVFFFSDVFFFFFFCSQVTEFDPKTRMTLQVAIASLKSFLQSKQ